MRQNRYLTCFYCGRKSSVLYDGSLRSFECIRCDATNYLDENGDIADPPVATDREATPARQYVVPRTFALPSSPTTTAIFCATCLKNQHLLSASLAQYLPDPDDPDYAEREKNLHRFRKHQERVYPQICAECEPRVRQRLQQATYTAKTDALRRVIDRSAKARKNLKGRGWLELFDIAGWWLWITGFVLQLAWHAVVVRALGLQYVERAKADDTLFAFKILEICGPLVGMLPPAERLLRWSSRAGIFAVWWNPKFAENFRGLTIHNKGLAKWYISQAVILAVRVGLPMAWDMSLPSPQLLDLQIASHGITAVLSLLIFILGPRSIRINSKPLFVKTKPKPLLRISHDERSSLSRPDETKSLVELLDEIARSPTSTNPPSPTFNSSGATPNPFAGPLMGHTHTDAAHKFDTNMAKITQLRLQPTSSSSSGSSNSAVEEMDWCPTLPPALDSTTSQHRAFNTQGQRATQPFGAAPVAETHDRPFWYRVPPAPTTPAQRVFNPPNQPRLRPSPQQQAGAGSGFRFGGAGAGAGGGQRNGNGMVMAKEVLEKRERAVSFAEPSFFAEDVVPRKKGGAGDPRDNLMGLFGKGLTLEEEEKGGEGEAGWFRRIVGGGNEKGKGRKKKRV